MNFVLDGMLGKLTRWLRIMGYDAKYSTTLSDDELLSIAMNEKRVLLTRDLALYQRASSRTVEAYYVEGTNVVDWLVELSNRFNIPLNIDLEKSRCPKCGTKLSSARKEEIKEIVEKNTLMYYEDFWICPNCGAVYWQGAHWTNIRSALDKTREILNRKEQAR